MIEIFVLITAAFSEPSVPITCLGLQDFNMLIKSFVLGELQMRILTKSNSDDKNEVYAS